MTLPGTFWAKTATTDCLIWTGAVNSKGYPCFAVDGVSKLAHRLIWEDANGPIPDGMNIDHTCRVRNCVRLAHLELVTIAENTRRGQVASGYHIGGHCGRGHTLTEENAVKSKRGQLRCRACARQDEAEHAARRAIAKGEFPAELIRNWARERGIPVSARGRLSPALRQAYIDAHMPLARAS